MRGSSSRGGRGVSLAAVALVVAAAAFIALHAGAMTRGLRAEYFENLDRTGTPAFTRVDPELSADQLTASWLGDPPPSFSVRWFGYLAVDRAGTYALGTRSDDGSWLTVDGERIVDNGGLHSTIARAATVTLGRGVHTVLIDYTQQVADYDIGLVWGPDDHSLSDVPGWRLSPSRMPLWKFTAGRGLRWIELAAFFFALTLLVWNAATIWRPFIAETLETWPRTAVLLLFAALTIIQTWPLASHPARLSRNDNGDTVLNEWAISWVAHQAPRDPLHLFDGNIFYPERDTLAYSEAMIVQSALSAPLLWAGASPVLAYNVVLLLGFMLGGWTMSIVMTRWTGSWAAGILSGMLFAFNAHAFTRLPHLQAQHVEFIPLALFALDAFLRRPGPRRAAALAGWFILQALTSVYLLVFTAVALVAGTIVRPEDWTGRRFRRVATWTVAAALIAAIVLTPVLLPYWHAFHDQGLSRSEGDVIGYAASWQDYLSTPGRIHFALWAAPFFTGTALFPGALATVLTLVAIATGVAWRDRRARMCLAFGIAGVALSFGGKLPGYLLLFRYVPLFQGVRAVSRFGFLGIVAEAMLAGFGLIEVLKRVRSPHARASVAYAAMAIALLEPFCAPIWFARYTGISPIYATIRSEPNAIVVEIPFWSTTGSFQHAPYMLNSTQHWKPMLNGYSGFQPPSFERHYAELSSFPSQSSLEAMRRWGVTDVFVHENQIGTAARAAFEGLAGVERIRSDGDIVLFHIHELPAR